MNLTELAETGLVPDVLIRVGIRRLIADRIRPMRVSDPTERMRVLDAFVKQVSRSPLAVATDSANQQHYEVPVEFFQQVLGPRMKYSSCYFLTSQSSLAEAETEMLRITCQRAEIEDGMHVLELGCGWGSLTLWMAEQFPSSEITAVSNSTSQRKYIESCARTNGLENIRVITVDMRDFKSNETFDRIVSIEMFEHMRNYELLFQRIANWLTPSGKVFVHVFCHRDTPYFFETEGADNWMGRNFFTGGTMPSANLFSRFDEDLTIERQWKIDGLHYWQTCKAWLENLDRNRKLILSRFQRDLGNRQSKTQLQRWRMFFMACAELFRYKDGHEWFVAHYLFGKASSNSTSRLLYLKQDDAFPEVASNTVDY